MKKCIDLYAALYNRVSLQQAVAMCAQIFSLVVASVGLAAFAIVLSLVEQLIIQARLLSTRPYPLKH